MAAAAPARTSATARRMRSDGGRARLIRSGRPGSALTATSRVTTGRADGERRGGRRRRHGGDRDIKAEPIGAPAEKVGIGDNDRNRGMSSSARRCQTARARSGPIPAGSPSVNAKGCTILLLSPTYAFGHLVFDHRLAPQIVEIALGLRAEFLLEASDREFPAFPAYRIWSPSCRRPRTSARPRPSVSGGVRWPTAVLSRMSRSCCGRSAENFDT